MVQLWLCGGAAPTNGHVRAIVVGLNERSVPGRLCIHAWAPTSQSDGVIVSRQNAGAVGKVEHRGLKFFICSMWCTAAKCQGASMSQGAPHISVRPHISVPPHVSGRERSQFSGIPRRE